MRQRLGSRLALAALLSAAAAQDGPVVYLLVRPWSWCNCQQTDMGAAPSAEDCANKCKAKDGCQFFVYSARNHHCWQSDAKTPSCPAGLRWDWRWDFYQVPTDDGPVTATKVELWRTGFVRTTPDLDTLGDPAATYYVQQVDMWQGFYPLVSSQFFWYCFAARFSSAFVAPYTATATFYTVSDDGTLFFINGNLVVNNDGLHGRVVRSGRMPVKAGKGYEFELRFFQGYGGSNVAVIWQPCPGCPLQWLRGQTLSPSPPPFSPPPPSSPPPSPPPLPVWWPTHDIEKLLVNIQVRRSPAHCSRSHP